MLHGGNARKSRIGVKGSGAIVFGTISAQVTSREAAIACSPRREPWVGENNSRLAAKRRQQSTRVLFAVAASRLTLVFQFFPTAHAVG